MMIKYLETFFKEKDLIEETWELVDDTGMTHFISSAVVLEQLAISPVAEQEAIAKIIRKLDFANGNVNHFLQHLATALINTDGRVL